MSELIQAQPGDPEFSGGVDQGSQPNVVDLGRQVVRPVVEYPVYVGERLGETYWLTMRERLDSQTIEPSGTEEK